MRTWSGKIEKREWLIKMSTRLCSSHLLLSVYAMQCDVEVIGTNYEGVIIMNVSDVIWICCVIPYMHFLSTDLECVINLTCSICCKLNGLWISKQVRTFIPQNFSRRTNSLIREASAFQAFQWRCNSVINVICDAIKSEPFITKDEESQRRGGTRSNSKFWVWLTYPSTIIPFLLWNISQRLCEQTGQPNVEIGLLVSTTRHSRDATIFSAIQAVTKKLILRD